MPSRQTAAPARPANMLATLRTLLSYMSHARWMLLLVAVLVTVSALANLFGYTSDLRSMSQGRAASSMELYAYEEVPPNVAAEIIEKRNSK